jgi:hypothetical protein
MIENVKTKLMAHICSGCYGQTVANLPQGKET